MGLYEKSSRKGLFVVSKTFRGLNENYLWIKEGFICCKHKTSGVYMQITNKEKEKNWTLEEQRGFCKNHIFFSKLRQSLFTILSSHRSITLAEKCNRFVAVQSCFRGTVSLYPTLFVSLLLLLLLLLEAGLIMHRGG